MTKKLKLPAKHNKDTLAKIEKAIRYSSPYSNPGDSDIFGALQPAERIFKKEKKRIKKLYIWSDMVHIKGSINFNSENLTLKRTKIIIKVEKQKANTLNKK